MAPFFFPPIGRDIALTVFSHDSPNVLRCARPGFSSLMFFSPKVVSLFPLASLFPPRSIRPCFSRGHRRPLSCSRALSPSEASPFFFHGRGYGVSYHSRPVWISSSCFSFLVSSRFLAFLENPFRCPSSRTLLEKILFQS